MLNYAVHAENGSLYNTPPVFGVYALGLVMKWLRGQGGLDGDREGERAEGGEALRRNRPHRLLPRHRATRTCRSLMNVTFRLATEELEKQFVKDVDRRGSRRPQGSPVGRRHAGVDLQRLPRSRRRRARRLHEGVRADARLTRERYGPFRAAARQKGHSVLYLRFPSVPAHSTLVTLKSVCFGG